MQIDINIEDRLFRFAYLKQVRKDKARRLFNNSIEIFILPKKLNHLSEVNLLKSVKSSYNVDFDELIKFKWMDDFDKKFGPLKFYYIDI